MARNDQPQHTETIDLQDGEAVRRWASRFGIDESKLRQLVAEVGPVADRISWRLMQERGLVSGDPTPDS